MLAQMRGMEQASQHGDERAVEAKAIVLDAGAGFFKPHAESPHRSRGHADLEVAGAGRNFECGVARFHGARPGVDSSQYVSLGADLKDAAPGLPQVRNLERGMAAILERDICISADRADKADAAKSIERVVKPGLCGGDRGPSESRR